MKISSREESLKKAQNYLETLLEEFEDEIEKLTLDIHIHKALKEQFETQHTQGKNLRKCLQIWRKKSYALHLRRTRLKNMKDCLERQIHDLQTAQNSLKVNADPTFPFPAGRKGCCVSQLVLKA